MSFKRYRIIFILIFMLTSDGNCGTYAENANDKETTKQHMMPNEMENAQSGKSYLPFQYPIILLCCAKIYIHFICTIQVVRYFYIFEMISNFCHDFNCHFTVFLRSS